MKKFLQALLTVAALSAVAPAALAQAYPNKPIRMIVPQWQEPVSCIAVLVS